VVATTQARSSLVEDVARDIAELVGEDFLARIQTPPQGEDPAAERRRRAEALVAVVDGRREPLEQFRSRFIRRLHRASDDFAATEALRRVEAALSSIPRPDGVRATGSSSGHGVGGGHEARPDERLTAQALRPVIPVMLVHACADTRSSRHLSPPSESHARLMKRIHRTRGVTAPHGCGHRAAPSDHRPPVIGHPLGHFAGYRSRRLNIAPVIIGGWVAGVAWGGGPGWGRRSTSTGR
jgi:hypothetical protein